MSIMMAKLYDALCAAGAGQVRTRQTTISLANAGGEAEEHRAGSKQSRTHQ